MQFIDTLLHMHAEMETVRQWGKIVYLLLVEGGKNMPSFSSGSVCVNCEAEPKFLLD